MLKYRGAAVSAAAITGAAFMLSFCATVCAAEPARTGGAGEIAAAETQEAPAELSAAACGVMATFDVNLFRLPQEARMLVVVEGLAGSYCGVYAYELTGEGWMLRMCTPGIMGRNGMSSHRTVGDKTTPVGLFQLNTPFGQCAPREGFPEDYIQVNKSHVWSDSKNRLVEDAGEGGEHVGRAGYAGHYDYVLDAGFNRNAVPGQGSALFLHCLKESAVDTSGCVAIPKECMAQIMCLYGTYGNGACYIAQAPAGGFGAVYDSYGANNGLSPDGWEQTYGG